MNLLEDIHHYCEAHSSPLKTTLSLLIEETQAHVPGAHMITGPLAGQFLSMISQMLHPQCIIELGTYTGYSAICLAQGLKDNGVLHTIDTDARWNTLREKYWKEAGVDHKIIQHIGPAVEVLPTLDVTPDLAFIDADKGNYWTYTDMLIDRMNSGSWIIVDNVLFKNEVLQSDDALISKAGQHIKNYNDKLQKDNRIEHVMLPIRDGMTLIRIQ